MCEEKIKIEFVLKSNKNSTTEAGVLKKYIELFLKGFLLN